MNIAFEDLAKNSFVISIDQDRLDRFYNIFKAVGWPEDILPEHVEGVITPITTPRESGCSKSHIKVIELAKERGLPFCLIFEDDAYPMTDFKERINYTLSNLPCNAKGCLLGYVSPPIMDFHYQVNDAILSIPNNIRRYWGSHAYVVFKDCYDEIISLLKSTPHGDHTFHKIINTYAASKPIFIQCIYKSGIHFKLPGYIYNYRVGLPNPPEGFPRYEDLINIENINKEKKDEIL
jgi:GR25 family glycosyltransferase involved in LPS biosynthesis